MNRRLSNASRAVASAALFAVTGPLLATIALWSTAGLSSRKALGFPWRELSGAYLELGYVALAIGVAFVLIASLWGWASGAYGRPIVVAAGGLSAVLVLGLPYVGPLFANGRIGGNAFLIVLLGLGVGLAQGLFIPRSLVPFMRGRAHGA